MTDKLRDELMHSNGTTPYETFSIIIPSFFINLIVTFLIRDVESVGIRLFLEFSGIVIPLILIMTAFAQQATGILCALILSSIILCFVLLKTKGSRLQKPVSDSIQRHRSQLAFVTLARSTINLLSVIAILAVDFRVFPRTFTKTETYGYSLMDTGVGLYIFANGVVAPELRGTSPTLSNTLKGVIPVVVLGIMRALIVKEIDYHVPVAEYGTHWNFFITLAFIKIVGFLVLSIVPVHRSFFSGVSLLVIHETILQLGAAKYVFGNTPRDNLFSANREGIVSTLGYTGLYFFSLSFGNFVKSNVTSRTLNARFLFRQACLSGFLLWASLILAKNFGISRRLTNSAYCVWILFIATCMVALFYLGEIVYNLIYNSQDFCKVPIIYEAINYNGLVFFLVANCLTGIINLICNTLTFGTVPSLNIIIMYMAFNCGVISLLYRKRIKLKL